jgi:hypothetical protein
MKNIIYFIILKIMKKRRKICLKVNVIQNL